MKRFLTVFDPLYGAADSENNIMSIIQISHEIYIINADLEVPREHSFYAKIFFVRTIGVK